MRPHRPRLTWLTSLALHGRYIAEDDSLTVSRGYALEEVDAGREPAADGADAAALELRQEGGSAGTTSANTALEPAFRSLNVSTDAPPPSTGAS